MARSGDVDAGVLGKGGFGCVYRYAIDSSFTPPSSMDLSLSLTSTAMHRHASGSEAIASSQLDRGRSSPRSRLCDQVVAVNSVTKPASLVAIKLCRTPCSGSFDELQKTSLVDKRTRRAEMQDDAKTHVRIVRGEGRIFQYLQAAHQASGRCDDPPLVKLLANLPPNGISRDSQLEALDISFDEEDGPPTRLLVFEKLIEIDAERTSQGWVKSNKMWSHERVEKVALEVMRGLQFLHEHNVTHGDLKPSNLMLDPRTGVVKIIDLGASRRFVHLSNKERNNRRAVEEQDRHLLARSRPVARLAPELCEGLGSLTGSPYYMAPEILLQATRYVDVSGRARSVLEDYEFDFHSFLPREQWGMYHIGLSDLRRGWGIRADIWSWACTVQALMLKTIHEDQRPSSSTISPYDFSFSRHRDEMIDPLHEKSPSEDEVPRFHQWCRVLPLLIVRIALEPVPLTSQAEGCSPALRSALKASLRHQDLRPTADELVHMMQAPQSGSRAPSAHFAGGRSASPAKSSVRQPSVDGSRHLSQPTSSPRVHSGEFDGSRFTTPTLSHGASSTSSPQNTCETANRECQNRTPDGDRKVRSETGTTESTFLAPPSAASRRSAEDQGDNEDPVPQGFELVSPARSEKALPRSADRPATANATLQTTPLRDSVSAHVKLASRAALPRSQPSTPNRAVTEVATSRFARGVGDRSPLGSRVQRVERGVGAEGAPPLAAAGSQGLGIEWPLEGMRSLRLNPSAPYRGTLAGPSASVPSSPASHGRGASVPMFGSTVERSRTPLRVPAPVAMSSARRMLGEDIGGSPRCNFGDSRHHKHGSLMATLKEKQVRLKEGSMKLMGKRSSGMKFASDTGHRSASDDGRDHVDENVYRIGHLEGYQDAAAGDHSEHLSAAPLVMSPVEMRSPEREMRFAGSSSRRSTIKTGDDQSRTKPLIRRLFTWSTSS
ncbi:STE/STE11 protein kinase [Pseudozyma hubeiensis SY62]|uniref:STE/STE11 protein kinase n=1 Tax=Pseudozyma hubeiensis (strain SY62) TaxID=1305764 RepID=R9P5R7_PSEHS|nr:STE/STE11 protein kinase [Pseudozyma hubeiensis SY62]GAC93435.1 STE/STE11 protein kinase [Pseudozyma hubeiensis SY62]